MNRKYQSLKIISWNCNGKFREKFKEIAEYDANVYVIQECEDSTVCQNAEYKQFAKNSLWVGDSRYRGLGIFAKEGVSLTKNDWNSYCLKWFLPVKINSCIDLVGVWAQRPYIEEYYVYQSTHIDKYTNHTILFGDFNSNSIWDKEHRGRSHGDIINELASLGIVSAYHYLSGEIQGRETKNTFYQYRHQDKPFHIDHCFAHSSLISSYSVLDNASWLRLSDHMPMLLEIQL